MDLDVSQVSTDIPTQESQSGICLLSLPVHVFVPAEASR